MKSQRFVELVQAYGADPRRWPEAERSLYAPFVSTAEGAALLAQAEQVDAFLDGWSVSRRDETFNAHVLMTALSGRRRRVATAWLSSAFAACAVLGFVIGFQQVSSLDSDAYTYSELLLGSNLTEDFP